MQWYWWDLALRVCCKRSAGDMRAPIRHVLEDLHKVGIECRVLLDLSEGSALFAEFAKWLV